eukprot:TRINITY_DN86432_c0_g1_i1.p1 TRINITY_DN86432_c0_g1~~TRINITY_DN86432_c0_g1_i1.p1  ORF type:complete len:341 (-),score=69.85 TRINITY_DN86432_c0_g1_i1:87-1109(-)
MAGEAERAFAVTLVDGRVLQISVPESGKVEAISKQVAKELQLAEHCFVQLTSGSSVLSDSTLLADLAGGATDFNATVQVTAELKPLKQAASKHELYEQALASAEVLEADAQNQRRRVRTKPFPMILDVLMEMGGDKVEVPYMTRAEGDLLCFKGELGELLLPPMDMSQLGSKLGVEKLEAVTLSIGVNSHCYDQGLGIGLHPDGNIDDFFGGKQPTCIKFHPGMQGGLLRVEGPDSFPNQFMDFTPLNLAGMKEFLAEEVPDSTWPADALHTLQVTLRTTGRNTVYLKAANEQAAPAWQRDFNSNIFDGLTTPSVFAWLDCGDFLERGGVLYGPLQLDAE